MAINGKPLYENVARGILDMIHDDPEYCVGAKLPTEMQLAERFHVGRNTVRDAIRFLIIHEIVEIRRGRGTFVISDDFKMDSNPIAENLVDVKLQIRDLFETRFAIEPQIAYYAAKRATDKELKDIGELIQIIERDVHNPNADRFKQEAAFHSAIIYAAKNEFMTRLIPIIEECVYKVLEYEYNEQVTQDISIQDHRVIYEFLLEHDAENARRAMATHIARCMYHTGIKPE